VKSGDRIVILLYGAEKKGKRRKRYNKKSITEKETIEVSEKETTQKFVLIYINELFSM